MGGTLLGQLGSVDPRPMGFVNYGWLPIRIFESPISGQAFSGDEGLTRTTGSGNHRGCGTVVQGSNSRDRNSSRQICIPDYPGGKEVWVAEISGELERVEPICEGQTF